MLVYHLNDWEAWEGGELWTQRHASQPECTWVHIYMSKYLLPGTQDVVVLSGRKTSYCTTRLSLISHYKSNLVLQMALLTQF